MKGSRAHRQVVALVQLLEALPEEQLAEILDGLGIPKADRDAAAGRRNWKYCQICGLVYPRCRAAYADDHDFQERPKPRRPAEPADDGPEALREALEPGRSTT